MARRITKRVESGRILLSNYQYKMLEVARYGISMGDAGRYKQTAFASLVRRGYVEFNSRGARFVLTRDGRDAIANFNNADVERLHPSDVLARYVDDYLNK